MKASYRFWIAGGDRRQQCLAALLEQDGHSVETIALNEGETADLADLSQADCVVLPVPPEEGGMLYAPLSQRRISMQRLAEQLRPGQLVCSGGVTDTLRQAAEGQGIRLVNYLARPELAESNAIPTAEGAIRIAMEELPCTIHGCKVLVLGGGRCGMALARRLQGLYAQVTVSARSWKDLARIESEGMTAVPTDTLGQDGNDVLTQARLVVNTIPALILEDRRLGQLSSRCLVIDLASKPGGVDQTAARRRGVKVITALGLPGKESPQTAAENLRDGIYHSIRECER